MPRQMLELRLETVTPLFLAGADCAANRGCSLFHFRAHCVWLQAWVGAWLESIGILPIEGT